MKITTRFAHTSNSKICVHSIYLREKQLINTFMEMKSEDTRRKGGDRRHNSEEGRGLTSNFLGRHLDVNSRAASVRGVGVAFWRAAWVPRDKAAASAFNPRPGEMCL
jgi:hypothetical protein